METRVWKDEAGHIWLEEPHKPYPWIKVSGDRREVRRSTKEMLAHHKLVEMVPRTMQFSTDNAPTDVPPEPGKPYVPERKHFWKGLLVTLPDGVEVKHTAVGVIELHVGHYVYIRDDADMIWRSRSARYKIDASVIERRIKELTERDELDWVMRAWIRGMPYADRDEVLASDKKE